MKSRHKCKIDKLRQGLTCACPDDEDYVYGPRCELRTARFNSGFAWYAPLDTCENSSLRLAFRSNVPTGTILYSGPIETSAGDTPPDFIYLVLVAWEVQLYLNLGKKTYSISVMVKENVTATYNVRIAWNRDEISLGVTNCGLNETCYARVNKDPGSIHAILNAAGPLQLGGVAPMVSLDQIASVYSWEMSIPMLEPFIGCVSDLVYNDKFYDLNKTSNYKNHFRTCVTANQAKIIMSSESVLIIIGILLFLLSEYFATLYLIEEFSSFHYIGFPYCRKYMGKLYYNPFQSLY